jgi:hypothetical protein
LAGGFLAMVKSSFVRRYFRMLERFSGGTWCRPLELRTLRHSGGDGAFPTGSGRGPDFVGKKFPTGSGPMPHDGGTSPPLGFQKKCENGAVRAEGRRTNIGREKEK